VIPGDVSLVLKQQGHEADHSFLSYFSLSHLHVVVLKQMIIFTIYLILQHDYAEQFYSCLDINFWIIYSFFQLYRFHSSEW
jgi:hypothetical protein